MPSRGETSKDALAGHWFVDTAYGNRQFLSQDNARETIAAAMKQVNHQQAFWISGNKAYAYFGGPRLMCDQLSIIDQGDVRRKLDQLLPGSSGVDFISETGEEVNSLSIAGELYSLDVRNCSFEDGWLRSAPNINYVIKSGPNLFVFNAFLLLKLSKTSNYH